MYVEFDDGREQLIARSGPSHLGDLLSGNLRVVAGVTSARESRDYGQGGRTLEERFLPAQTARQVAAPAQRLADRLAADPRAYSMMRSNSNSYAADVAEPLFGRRPGDDLTPGHKQRLDRAPRVRPYDITPAMARY